MNAIAERVALDTDVVSRLLRGSLTNDIAERLTGAVMLITFVTVGELFRGAVHARWGPSRIATLTSWLNEIPAIPSDSAVARRWGELTGSALRAGRPLPANDAWIAACCLVHGVALATYNLRDFERIDALQIITAR
ncbi:MAG: PIN domain-containing protein [Actinomycetota bacterium]|nr:PIN domain-containing protein [Actinomycetota bacterium]